MEKQFSFGLVRSWNYWRKHLLEDYPEMEKVFI